MARQELTKSASVIRGGSLSLLGRICAQVASGAASPQPKEGLLVKQVDVSSISVTSFSPNGIVGTDTPSVSDIIHDTLQTAGVWGLLDDGGNAEYFVPVALYDSDDPFVTVDIVFTLTSGSVVKWRWTISIADSAPSS